MKLFPHPQLPVLAATPPPLPLSLPPSLSLGDITVTMWQTPGTLRNIVSLRNAHRPFETELGEGRALIAAFRIWESAPVLTILSDLGTVLWQAVSEGC